jgi:hypothetical protein
MAVSWSDPVRNAVLDAWATAVGASPKLRLYAGAVPADETAALGGATQLIEYPLGSTWTSAASAGSKSLSSLPLSGAASAAGTASFYRLYNSAGTVCHEQGTVGTSGADMTIDNAVLAVGQTVRVTGWSKTAPH